MSCQVRLHYDNGWSFDDPHVWIWYSGSAQPHGFAPTGSDDFGPVFDVTVRRPSFGLKFKDGPGMDGPWEDGSRDRSHRPAAQNGGQVEIWCQADKAFVYYVRPRAAEPVWAEEFLAGLSFPPGLYVPDAGGRSGLGANLLADGRVLFGFYHPNAARVYVMGGFNDWQRPGHDRPDPQKFLELKRYRGYFGAANTWLGVTDRAGVGDEYKFVVQGGVCRGEKGLFRQYFPDPYSRRFGESFQFNNSVIVDPTSFQWHDAGWTTPDMADLILYEMSVYGFTEGDPDIRSENRGKFSGVTERIESGYFDRLGVTALSLMPLAEVPSMQGPGTLGYNSSLFMTVERDFGAPDDLRRMVDAAHAHGLAVLLDEVFNHTDNGFNPLWQMILEHPDEEGREGEGGLYFAGETPWGNRVATEKADVQNMLIDACKLLIAEYHVDGFRFDATHRYYMDHGFLLRLAEELEAIKPDVLLVAENLPNESDLNRQGFDGYAQWCNQFHDKVKALLREGPFEGEAYNADHLGDTFYFSKQNFASHTNNVVNYCESHDEHSVPHEIHYVPWLDHPATKQRKGRLGLFATMVALGQPMIYMGQEFNEERERNLVTVDWPDDLAQHGFFQWAHRLIRLRRRYPALRLRGYNPAESGQFVWVLGPWMPGNRGGGRRVIGWRTHAGAPAQETMVVMLNFENHDVPVDVALGIPGIWVKLADVDRVHDLPPEGTNSIHDPTTLHSNDGNFSGFVLPGNSGFIYKWLSSS